MYAELMMLILFPRVLSSLNSTRLYLEKKILCVLQKSKDKKDGEIVKGWVDIKHWTAWSNISCWHK